MSTNPEILKPTPPSTLDGLREIRRKTNPTAARELFLLDEQIQAQQIAALKAELDDLQDQVEVQRVRSGHAAEIQEFPETEIQTMRTAYEAMMLNISDANSDQAKTRQVAEMNVKARNLINETLAA